MAAPAGAAAPADAPAVEGFTCVGRLSDVLPGRGLAKAVVGPAATPVVLVNDGAGTLHALYGLCPHKYAEMQLGDIEDAAGPSSGGAGGVSGGIAVKCPRHRKKFNGGLNFRVRDGSSWVNQPCTGKYEPDWCLPVFDVRLQPAAAAAGAEVLVYVSNVPIRGTVPPPPPAGDSEGEGDGGAGKKGKGAKEGGRDGGGKVGAVVAHRHNDAGEAGVTWLSATVTGIEPVSADSSVYTLRCAFPAAAPAAAADPWSWHVSLRLPGDAFLSREYTPLSPLDEWRHGGVLRLCVKHYALGKLTSRLRGLDPGAGVEVTAPETTLTTPDLLPPSAAPAAAAVHPFPPGSSVLLVAGGTGVTPIMQLARWAVATRTSATEPGAGAGAGAVAPALLAIAVSQHTTLDQLAASELLALARAHPAAVRLLRLFTRSGVDTTGRPLVAAVEAAGGGAGADGEAGWIAHQRLSAPVLTAWHAAMGGTPPVYGRVVVSGPRGMFADVSAAVMAALHVPAAALVELEA